MSARPIFIGGTSSNAGKSWMATAICAWLRSRGVSVAPFKAQNMSNNSYPCAAGGEIGRAQVAQAEACGLEPEPAMNPILLKPSGNGVSQVVVNGRVWKTLSAREYYVHATSCGQRCWRPIDDLASRFDVVVIEGAGSVSELNLRQHDLVNLWLVTVPARAVAAGRRHRARRRVRVDRRHSTPAQGRGTRAVSRLRDQQVPRRRFAVRRRRPGAGGADRVALLRRVSVRRRYPSRCRRQPGVGDTPTNDAASRGRESRSSDCPHLSNATDFRLLTWADWVSVARIGPIRFRHPARQQEHDRRPRLAARHGLADWIIAQHRARRDDHRDLRRLSDARATASTDPTGVEGSAAAASTASADSRRDGARRREDDAGRSLRHAPVASDFGGYEIHLGVTTLDPIARAPHRLRRLEDGSDGWRLGKSRDRHLSARRVRTSGGVRGGVRRHAAGQRDQGGHYRRLGEWFDRQHQRRCWRARTLSERNENARHALGNASSTAADVRLAARGTISGRRPAGPHRVLSTRCGTAGRSITCASLNHQSCEGTAHHDRHRLMTEARARCVSRSRVRRGDAARRRRQR